MAAAVPKPHCPQAACLVAAGLAPRLLVPTDAEYAARQASYWSESAKLHPACIVRPENTSEVATAVQALAEARQRFAIRSGGHTNWAGANNITDGVTLDLERLNFVRYNAETETVAIGPSARWVDVYAALKPYGRVVAGGREGSPGVGGLVLGGGNTYFTAQKGWSCDHVVAYEVVLGDGRVVVADGDGPHASLFRVLKGGSSNFGVVTQVTMRALRCDRVWGGMAIHPKTAIPAILEATVAFTARVEQDPASNLLSFVFHLPEFRDVVAATAVAHVEGDERASAFDQWRTIPQLSSTCQITTLGEMATTTGVPAGYHDIWFTLSFKNDIRVLTYAAEGHDRLVESLKPLAPDGDFVTQCVLQPLLPLFHQRSTQAGGNVLGLENHVHEDAILFLGTAMLRTAEQEAKAYPRVKAWVDDLREYAMKLDCHIPWVYLNYADKSQDPLASYGPENVKKMRDAAVKYDPARVFQELCPGGFKISDVKS